LANSETSTVVQPRERPSTGPPANQSTCKRGPGFNSTTSLRVNFSWTLAGNVLYAALQWGILVVLARLGNPQTVGQFSLGLAITAPIQLFANLQLRSVQATDAALQFEFRDCAGLRLVMTVAAVCVAFILAAVLYRGETALTIAAFAISKGVEAMSDLVYGLWQQQERMDLIAKSLMLRGVVALLAAATGFAVFHAVWITVFATAVAWAGVLAMFDVPRAIAVAHQLGQTATPRFAAWRMKQLFSLALPLGIVMMLISLNANIPRYMISHFRSVRELGIFSALGYILMAGTTIVGALGQSATPRLASYASQGRVRQFRGLTHRLLLVGLALGIGGIVAALSFGRQIVTLIYGQEYAHDHLLFLWLMVAAATSFMASFAGYSLTAARHFSVQLPLFSLITALTLVLCYLMTNNDGAVGAAKALALVGSVQLAATLAILRHAERNRTADI